MCRKNHISLASIVYCILLTTIWHICQPMSTLTRVKVRDYPTLYPIFTPCTFTLTLYSLLTSTIRISITVPLSGQLRQYTRILVYWLRAKNSYYAISCTYQPASTHGMGWHKKWCLSSHICVFGRTDFDAASCINHHGFGRNAFHFTALLLLIVTATCNK